MLKRYLGISAALALLNACSGRYVVGQEDDDSEPEGGSASAPIDMGDAGRSMSSFGGTPSMVPGNGGAPTMVPGNGGAPTMNPPMEGGATMMNPPSMNPGMDPPTCGWQLTTGAPMRVYAEPAEAWRRLTRFLLNDEREPGMLPETTTLEWVEATASRLLDENPDAPVFRHFLELMRLNETTAETYGAALLDPVARVRDLFTSSDANRTAGILTDPAFLEQYPTIGRRGSFILGGLICLNIGAPPPDEGTLPNVPGVSRRQELEELTSRAACSGCHSFLNPLGFSLENFGADGEYREVDDGVPVNASGSFTIPAFTSGTHTRPESPNFSFMSYRDLAPRLASSCEVARCFTEKLLDQAFIEGHGLNRAIIEYALDQEEVTRLAARFVEGGLSIRDLVRLIVTSSTFIDAPAP